jgi:hypothetical protein
MFKYAARHWAHYACWLERKVGEAGLGYKTETFVNILKELPSWQIGEFPVIPLEDLLRSYGRTDSATVVLRAAIKLAKERESSERPAGGGR